MKILHIINSLVTGGAEKLIIDTLPLYKKEGVDVDLVLLNGKDTPFHKKMAAVFTGNIFSLGSYSVYNPIQIINLYRYIKKYDLIHVHLFPSLYWVAIVKFITNSKTKLVYTEHNITNRRFESTYAKPLDSWIYNKYDCLVGITQPICDLLANRFGRQDTIRLIENGIDLNQMRNALTYSQAELSEICGVDVRNKKVLLQVSAFRPQKDQLTLIKSLNRLPDNVVLVLAGGGELLEEVKSKTNELGLLHRVFFVGIRTDIPSLQKSVDVIILSTKYEGMSLSSIEGMASGKPFIASDVPGLSEIVRDAGILFPYGESDKLAEIISQLLENTEYYNQTVKSCQTRAGQYDISKLREQHIRLYSELTKTPLVSRHD